MLIKNGRCLVTSRAGAVICRTGMVTSTTGAETSRAGVVTSSAGTVMSSAGAVMLAIAMSGTEQNYAILWYVLTGSMFTSINGFL